MKNFIRKKHMFAILIALALLAFAACRGNTPTYDSDIALTQTITEETTPEEAPDDEETTNGESDGRIEDEDNEDIEEDIEEGFEEGFEEEQQEPDNQDLSLRVSTTGHQQWDGAQVSIAELGLELGYVYEIAVRILSPVAAGNVDVGMLVQTSGPLWRHIIAPPLSIGGLTPSWQYLVGQLDLTDVDNMPAHIQIVKNGSAPNSGANIVFYLHSLAASKDGELVASLDFSHNQVYPFMGSGDAFLQVVPTPTPPLHNINFMPANWLAYSQHLVPGSQVELEHVEGFGSVSDYAVRITNTTGNWNSGAGNFARLYLPQQLPQGASLVLSWDVYIPAEGNEDKTSVPGAGIVFNGNFGSPDHQPTNNQDLNTVLPLGQWVTTTTEFTLDHASGAVDHITFRFRVNEAYRQPAIWYIGNILLTVQGVEEAVVPYWDLSLPSLRQLFAPYFTIGAIMEPSLINNNPFGVVEMFLHHYGAVTAENAMKPDAIGGGSNQLTRPTALNLNGARTMVNFAEEHGLVMIGHTLVWHSQSAPWVNQTPEGEPLTRAEAMDNMRWFIGQYAGYFGDRITYWDVTNEVVSNSGSANNANMGPEGSPVYPVGSWQRALRNYVPWYHAFANGADFEAGERAYDYIYYAFVFARYYAPGARLIYNDYNEWFPRKRDAIADMVEAMNERWHADSINNPAYGNPSHPDYGRLLIEVIGMQAHYSQGLNIAEVRDAIQRYAQTGARIHVTEMDITFQPEGAPMVMTQAQERAQANMYASLMLLYMEFADYIDRVSFWGREDGTSWRSAASPLLFDRFFRPKEAFWAVVDPAAWLDM